MTDKDYEELQQFKQLMQECVHTVFGEGRYVTITTAKKRFYKFMTACGAKPYAKENRKCSEIVFYALWDIYYSGVNAGSRMRHTTNKEG